MADFCMQCAKEIFGIDNHSDLSGFGDGTPLKEGYGYKCLCEGCGPIIVDDKGRCVYSHCPKHGEENG